MYTLYLSGPITGVEDYRKRFYRAHEALRGMDRNACILSPTRHPEGMSREQYMLMAYQDIAVADAVVFLPGWENSEGAKLEHAHARYVGKRCYELKETKTPCLCKMAEREGVT